jgi:hypothetical protein
MRESVVTRFFSGEPVVTVLFDAGQLEMLLPSLRAAAQASPSGELETFVAGLAELRTTTCAGPGVGVAVGDEGHGEVVRCAGSWAEMPEPRTREERRKVRAQQKTLDRELVSTYRDFRRCPVVSNAPTGLKYRISLEATMAISVDEAQLRLLSDALRLAVGHMSGPEPAFPGGPSRWELRELAARFQEVLTCWEDGGHRS